MNFNSFTLQDLKERLSEAENLKAEKQEMITDIFPIAKFSKLNELATEVTALTAEIARLKREIKSR